MTVYGFVTKENDQPLLRAEPDDKLFVVSSMPLEEIVRAARVESGATVFWGWVFLLVSPAIPIYRWWRGRRRKLP